MPWTGPWPVLGRTSASLKMDLAYLHLTVTHSKGQGQSQFDCKKFENESRSMLPYVSTCAAPVRYACKPKLNNVTLSQNTINYVDNLVQN